MGLLNLLKGPFTELCSFPEFLFEAFPLARLPCIVSAVHYLGIAICISIFC